MTVASPTPNGVSALRDDRYLAPRGPFAAIWSFLRRQPVGSIGMFLVLVFGLAGIFADVLAPYNPTANDFAAMTEPPSWAQVVTCRVPLQVAVYRYQMSAAVCVSPPSLHAPGATGLPSVVAPTVLKAVTPLAIGIASLQSSLGGEQSAAPLHALPLVTCSV